MAAPTAVEQTQTKKKPLDRFINSVYTTNKDSEYLSMDMEKLQDYAVDFLENEVGGDLKSLKNVGDLLENLREENNELEGQVN